MKQLIRLSKIRKHEGRRGAAMVEFAIVLPLLIMLVFGVIELGRAFLTYSLMSEAVREGARAGVVETNDATAITTATGVANGFLTAVSLNGATVSASIIPLTASVKAVDVRANFAFQFFGLNGIPNVNLASRSVMRQEGQ